MTRRQKYRKTFRKNRAYRTRRALRLIRKGQPKNFDEAMTLGMGALVEVGQGAFRTAYRIHGTSLLIKFPLMFHYSSEPNSWHDKEGKNHTRMEVKKIRALLEFPMWRKHLPPVYYFNARDGVMVTKYYRERKKSVVDRERNILMGELVKEFCGVVLGDITDDNVKVDDHLVIIDLGY
jgi:hypothetical protein